MAQQEGRGGGEEDEADGESTEGRNWGVGWEL
jgi:hypothetical protein